MIKVKDTVKLTPYFLDMAHEGDQRRRGIAEKWRFIVLTIDDKYVARIARIDEPRTRIECYATSYLQEE